MFIGELRTDLSRIVWWPVSLTSPSTASIRWSNIFEQITSLQTVRTRRWASTLYYTLSNHNTTLYHVGTTLSSSITLVPIYWFRLSYVVKGNVLFSDSVNNYIRVWIFIERTCHTECEPLREQNMGRHPRTTQRENMQNSPQRTTNSPHKLTDNNLA